MKDKDEVYYLTDRLLCHQAGEPGLTGQRGGFICGFAIFHDKSRV
jgi:hypothetical protein